MDINEILQNDKIKDLLDKTGIPKDKVGGVVGQALETVKNKFSENPMQLSSLLSENENTEEDNAFASILENDFAKNLTDKVGLSSDLASKAKTFLPTILDLFKSKLSGNNNQEGIAGLLGNLDLGDIASSFMGGNKKSGGIAGMIKGLFGK